MAEMTWTTDDLSITLRSTPSHDGYQEIIIAATRGGFSGIRDSWLDAGDIERFADRVHRMWRDLTGGAELYGDHGSEFSLTLTMATGGHVDIEVEIDQPWASLRIEARTDQTYLPALYDGLLEIR